MKTLKTLFLFCIIGLSPVAFLRAFSVRIHADITKESLSALGVPIGGVIEHFSAAALDQVQAANGRVDKLTPALSFPARHFTDERLSAGSRRLIDLKKDIVAVLHEDPPDGEEARQLLGMALHAVQDYYSHTTWIEGENPGIDGRLGKGEIPDPEATIRPCTEPTSVTGPRAGLSSGYYLGLTGCGNSFYLDGILNFSADADAVTDGKCYHGNYTMACVGMNKDNDVATYPPPRFGIVFDAMHPAIIRAGGVAPPNPLHPIARARAFEATTDYLKQIIDELSGNERALRALLDIKSLIGFVIDDTGSMGEEIGGVKSQIAQVVNVVRDDPNKRPEGWLLVRFGDPDVGQPFVTDDAEALLNAVNALTPRGGGDCPELSQEALRRAIGAGSSGSRLYLYTDASAKDSSLRNTVISEAQKKSVRLTNVLTGTCSPIDEAYVRGTAETGGQLFFINQFEIPKLFDLLKPQLAGDLVTVLTAKGTLTGPPIQLNVPVDSTLRTLIVSVSIDTKTSVVLRRPTGDPVNASDADARITHLTSGDILTIERPVSGAWRVELAGSGNYSIVAEGNSPLDFHRFDFVAPNDDLHGGFFPLPGQPLVGAPVVGQAAIFGPFASAAFKLVTESGATIADIPLSRNFLNAVADDFVGVFNLPRVPFRIVATGTDLSGVLFQRQFATVYRAQVVGVEVAPGAGDRVSAGRNNSFDFVIRNLGPAGAFRINATNNLGFAMTVNPPVLNLAGGASGSVAVSVNVPAGTPSGTHLSLTLTASRSDDSTIFNSAILDLTVEANAAPVADASATVAKIIAVNNADAIVQLNGTRSSDPDGDPLQYSWFIDGNPTAVLPRPGDALGTATVKLSVGVHQIVLVVSDGSLTNSVAVAVSVITGCQATDEIVALVVNSSLPKNRKPPLLASLQAACASFSRGSTKSGVNQLQAFQLKVRAEISRTDRPLADRLINAAQMIVDAFVPDQRPKR